MASPLWTVAAASVRGRGHEQTGAPCQDSSAVIVSPNGQWVALAASDGAGTAKRSEIGSDFVAREFSKCLIRLSEDCDRRPPGAWVSDRVIQDIVVLRNRLREQAGSDDISDYHCTLTAALIGPTGGITVHLGDGAIFGGAASSRAADVIDLAQDYFVSAPQNGEYANETVFLTEKDWVKNLRIQPVAAVDWVMLGTDGGMALAMVGESRPKSGFVVPVIRALIQEPDYAARCEALARILDDRQADRLTNDDKTLIAAIRSQYREVTGEFGPATLPAAGISSSAQQAPLPRAVRPAPSSPTGPAPGDKGPTGNASQASSRTQSRQASRGKAWTWSLVSVLFLVGIGGALAVWQYKSKAREKKDPPAPVVTKPEHASSPTPAAKQTDQATDTPQASASAAVLSAAAPVPAASNAAPPSAPGSLTTTAPATKAEKPSPTVPPASAPPQPSKSDQSGASKPKIGK